MDAYQASRDSERIESDIEQTRHEMAGTLGDIQRNLSPDQLMEQAMGYLEDHSGRIGTDIIDTVRNNPVPATFVGVGLVWLVVAGATRSQGDDGEGYVRSAYVREYGPVSAGLTERRGGAERRIDGAAGHGWYAHPAVGAATAAPPIERRHYQRRLAQAQTGTSRTATGRSGRYARTKGQRLQRQTRRFIEEQPLVVGALGLAIGAALGAALPVSREEARWAGRVQGGIRQADEPAAVGDPDNRRMASEPGYAATPPGGAGSGAAASDPSI